MTSTARSNVLLRLVSVLAVGAVAGALLVGFFFDGDFRAALRALGAGAGGASTHLGSTEVVGRGSARLQGRCSDPELVERLRTNARKAARLDAEDRCRQVPGAKDAPLSLRQDGEGEEELAGSGKSCELRITQPWTCVYDGR